MTREEFIAANPLTDVMQNRGITFKRHNSYLMCRCPFHDDKTPSMSVDPAKQLFKCHGCNKAGSVIDFLMEYDHKTIKDLLDGDAVRPCDGEPGRLQGSAPAYHHAEAVLQQVYPYHDERGELLYEVCRYLPKSFKQRRPDGQGGYTWSMEGVKRVLYRLPQVLKSQTVFLVEGERDVETLVSLGYQATCNPGGAGKWLDAYTESLNGKDIILCGDNDEPGRQHVNKVFASLAGRVKSVKEVRIPDSSKDVTDYVTSFADTKLAKAALDKLIATSIAFIRGVRCPIQHIADLEERYADYALRGDKHSFHVSAWLPSLAGIVRPLAGGDVVTIIADTGAGKTMLLQNMALHTELQTLLFELELADPVLFERCVAMAYKQNQSEVYTAYKSGAGIGDLRKALKHLWVCTQSKMTPELLDNYIGQSELIIGEPPRIVMLDYVQLMGGKGNSRYERVGGVAEQLKVIAKARDVIMVVASQKSRPMKDTGKDVSGNKPVSLWDAKNAGEVENSSAVVLGAWHPDGAQDYLTIRVLKNTRGPCGKDVHCKMDGAKQLIAEETSERQDLQSSDEP